MAHFNYYTDFTVEVFVVHQRKVLLRLHDKYKIWLSVGGHIEQNEDPNQAAIREVKEEVGLDIELYDGNKPFELSTNTYEELIPPYFLNIHSITESHRHIGLTYFASSTTDKVIPEKHTDVWKWLDREELILMKDLKPQILKYALKALDVISDRN